MHHLLSAAVYTGNRMQKDRPDWGRYSDPSLLILSSLANGPKHGYAMIEDISAFSGTRLEPGTLYGALTRLEARGWIAALESEARRLPYAITPHGRQALRGQLNTMHRIVTIGLD